MYFVKIFLVAAAAALAFSCSQATPVVTTNTAVLSNTKSTEVVAAITPGVRNAPVGNIDRKARLQAAQGVDLDEAGTDDTYATNCMVCHKDTGKGGKVTIKGKTLNAADLTSEKRKKQSDEALFKDISEGVPDEGMPAFQSKLSTEQITAVIAHVRGLQSK